VPTLAFTLIVHCVPLLVVVQPVEPGVVFCTTAALGDAAPSVSTIETDCVLAETYFGERAAVDLLDGIVIVNATLRCCCGVVPCGVDGSADDPLPPEQAATRQPTSSAPAVISMCFLMSVAPY
jgi:hypothetical protein